MHALKEKFVSWIAWHLPKSWCYHASIRVWANATRELPERECPSLRIDECLAVWK